MPRKPKFPVEIGGKFHTVRIPNWHPARLNELIGRHRMAISRRKRSDREIVAAYVLMAGAIEATGKRRVNLHITLSPRQRAADPDAYWKSLLDALVHCKALRNDNRQWVELMPVEFDRASTKATTIVLTDV